MFSHDIEVPAKISSSWGSGIGWRERPCCNLLVFIRCGLIPMTHSAPVCGLGSNREVIGELAAYVPWLSGTLTLGPVSPCVNCCSSPRSPSYPPPGCGKSKSKLKSEQDGISKTHKLLRRTCSSTVKADDVCAKSHRTFGRSLSSDPRAEQAMSTIKSHKLLGRPCPAAGKQEDCLTLKSHKLLTRSCSGDPRCEHNTNLKPHKLLSRSYSSNLRVEELYGLKNHKLLSKSYSGAPKSSKNEHFKEPNAEGRRLSLTSGLIGILTPSSSSSQPPVRKF